MASETKSGMIPAVFYRDPNAAVAFLQKAFGFETAMLVAEKDGRISHAEIRYGVGLIFVGGEWNEKVKSPASVGGKNTQSVHVHLDEDVDAHCDRARQAGAKIVQEPSDQFYGDRTYRALDLEGHMWTFGQTKRSVSVGEMEQASGLKIRLIE